MKPGFWRNAALLAGLCIALAQPAAAQKKELSYDQIFRKATSGLLEPLPTLEGWADDDHYLIRQSEGRDSSSANWMSVDVVTGKTEPYTHRQAVVQSNYGLSEQDKNATASPNGKWVAFTRSNNLFARELVTGREIQFTRDGSADIYSGYAAWLYYEEILGRASHYQAFWWSPDSRHIAFLHFDESQVPLFPIFHAEGQHGSLEQRHYPEAGDQNPRVRVGIVGLEGKAPVWADFNDTDDQYFGKPLWIPDGSSLWVSWMPRRQNDLKIFAVDPEKGIKREIYDEKQLTWVELGSSRSIEFLASGQGFIIKSDQSGWSQLYLHRMDGQLINPITQGRFTVTSLTDVDETGGWVYFQARKENSARLDFYRVRLNGKDLTRLSFGDFSHDAISLSPHARYFISTYSNLHEPPRMALLDSRGKKIRDLADSKAMAFADYALPRTELVRVKSRDSLFDLPLIITYPVPFDPGRKYPVLFSVYGGPDAGTVYDRWNRGWLVAQWWAQEGLIQVSMDNRSSGHFGKEGINYIFRRLGKYEIEDYMDGAKWLRSQPFVDSTKICITGGSFGGYITCMALTYGAGVFTQGIANYPVTDWALYDTHYTERYMDLPSENPEGYRITSPQNYVNQYRGLIRINHGSIDDNVHTQNSIQLINKLEDLDKDFEFMIYPGERHGWRGLKAIHSRNENAQFIYQHLLQKPMPQAFWE
jgi:dipeptidyl-peptidase-4